MCGRDGCNNTRKAWFVRLSAGIRRRKLIDEGRTLTGDKWYSKFGCLLRDSQSLYLNVSHNLTLVSTSAESRGTLKSARGRATSYAVQIFTYLVRFIAMTNSESFSSIQFHMWKLSVPIIIMCISYPAEQVFVQSSK